MEKTRIFGVMVSFVGLLIFCMVETANAYSFAVGSNGPAGNHWNQGSGWGSGPDQVDASFFVDPSLPDLGGRGSYQTFQYGSIQLGNSNNIPSTPGDLSITAYLNFTQPAPGSAAIPATALTFPGLVNDPGEDLHISFDSALVNFGNGGKYQVDLYPDASFEWAAVRNGLIR